MNKPFRVVAASTLLLLAACTGTQRVPDAFESDIDLLYPSTAAAPQVRTGSIMDNGARLYPTRRIYQSGSIKVGDIITIVLNETAQASRSSGLTAERETSNNLLGENQAASLFSAGSFLDGAPAGGSTLSSTGGGTADQSASLTGSISAVVVDVMENGNLVVLGEKQLTLTEGTETIRVKGVVRPEDIQPNNTVQSRRIANAQFSYNGSGELARAARVPVGLRALIGFWPF